MGCPRRPGRSSPRRSRSRPAMRMASAPLRMSPLPTTGTDTASRTRAMTPQSALPRYSCSANRPVHRDPVGPGLLHTAREGRRRLVAFRPAPAELHRDRMLHDALHGPHDGGGQIGLLHKSRAVPLRHDLTGGTPHVNVQVGQALPHFVLDPGGLGGHHLRLGGRTAARPPGTRRRRAPADAASSRWQRRAPWLTPSP